MRRERWTWIITVVALISLLCSSTTAIRFVIDREECFSHNAEYEADTVHLSFVVIKAESPWEYIPGTVDFIIKKPNGDLFHEMLGQTDVKFEFEVHEHGVYRFCFFNKSPYHETIDFDVHISHFTYHDEHAKDEHFGPLMEQLSRLEEALYNIQFEQHWLESQTDRQALVNEKMSRKAMHKAMLESVALVGASLLQVYLLHSLFDRKLPQSSRV
ncbi:Transmembrane emp24 domain-containing protein p24beta2 [Linum perenne]